MEIRYTGFQIADEFVVGYGLDHRGMFRNLPVGVSLDPEQLEEGVDWSRSELLEEVLRLAREVPVPPDRVET